MKYILLSAAGILLIFLVALHYIPIGIEPLTEMYFEDHTKLPKNIFPTKDYNFSFTVHNLEYIYMDYSYLIKEEHNNQITILKNSSFSLANNGSITIFQPFKIKDKDFQRAEISIELTKLTENPNQRDPNLKNITLDLHFWVDQITGPTVTITPD